MAEASAINPSPSATPAALTSQVPAPARRPVPVAAMLSDTGRIRQANEDSCGARPEFGIYVVCDGMGGAAFGEVASRLARDTFLNALSASASGLLPPRTRLQEAVRIANQAVHRQAQRSRAHRGMGTTMVAALCDPASPTTLWIAHVGDSRCYRLREHTLEQLTIDHSLIEEQIRAGILTRAEAANSPIRNIITRAVGSYPSVEAEIASHELQPGDLLLLASDGLTRELEDHDILELLERASLHPRDSAPGDLQRDLQSACRTLVDTANQRGGADNITVLLLTLAQPASS